jgi:hypothetical protein
MSLPVLSRVLSALLCLAALHAQSADPDGRFHAGAEVRTRYDFVRGESDAQPGDGYLMTRIRFSGLWKPAGGFSIRWEVQDARLIGVADQGYSASFSNRADLRTATIEWSSSGPKPWTVTAGRQEFSLGEERLVGSDSEWCNISRSFEGLKVSRAAGSWQWEAFHFNVVEPSPGSLDRPFAGPRIAGGTASFTSEAGGWSVQPFGVYAGAPELYTVGGLVELRLGPGVKSWSEMAVQTGHNSRSWAGVWGLDLEIPAGQAANAVLGASYSRASGDSDPADGRDTTFHDLYPAGHNGCGLLDPFAWRNIEDAGVSFEWPVTSRFSIQAENHAYWLATTKDGLYADGGPAAYLLPAARSRYVGDQINFGVTFKPASQFTLFVGAARLTGGSYLRHAGGTGATTIALGLRWQI